MEKRRLLPKTLFAVFLSATSLSFFGLFGLFSDRWEQKIDFSLSDLHLSGREVYRADEAPQFVIDIPQPEEKPTLVARLTGILGLRSANAADDVASALKVEVTNYYDPNIKIAAVAQSEGGKVAITVPRPDGNFRPGQYAMHLRMAGAGNEEVSRDFSWGVLAVNTDQSVYVPGQAVLLQMGALTDVGSTICRGDLELNVTDPAGRVETFTTKDGTIAYGKECRGNNVTDKPDYSADYKVSVAGKYLLKLTNLKNNFSIEDSFIVQESVPFKVERIGATRINPTRADYAMSFRITANQDFAGEISETVPGNFAITETGGATVQVVGDANVLTWYGVAFKAGEVKTFRYVYDAPNVSPKIYALGTLNFSGEGNFKWQEARRWQIAADATKTAVATNTWATAATWSPSGVPAAGDDVVITGGYTVSIAATVSANPATITIGGATAGVLQFYNSAAAGNYTLTVTGAVTVNSNGQFIVTNRSTTNAHTLNIGGNLTVAGTFNMTTATDDNASVVFNGSSQQTISGAGATCTFYSLTANNSSATGLVLGRNISLAVSGSQTATNLTVSANRILDLASYTADRATTGAGTITINSGSTLIIGGTGDFPANYTTNTINAASAVNYNGTTQSVNAFTYGNLQINGSGTKTSAGAITVSGNLSIGNGATLSHGSYNLTVTGTSTIGGGTSGGLILTSSTGTKQFISAVTVANGATWNNSGNSAVNFRGGLTNNGTFTAGTGVYTFDTNSQNLNGTISIPNVAVTGITLTNNNSLTVGTALSGTGGLTNAASSSLTIGGTSGITTLTASASGNTVTYNGGSQTVKAATYYILTMNGSGTAVLGGTVSATTLNVSAAVLNTDNQSLSVSGTTTVNGGLGITTGTSGTISFGNLTIGATGSFSNSANGNFSISGDFSNSNTFSAGTGTTVTLNGAGGSTQNISGNSTFANLTATASSARTIRFAASSTTTVTGTWTVTGASSQLITLTSSTTSQWSVNPTTAAISYVNVSYSNNTSASAICATYSQSSNGNNTNWNVTSGGSCTNNPSAPILYNNDGGANQIAFNNARQNSTTPVFRVSATHSASFDRLQIELNTAPAFGGTAYTETFSGTYSSGTQYNLATTGSLSLPSTNGVTYYVRARASADGGSNWGDWSSGTWTYTYTSTAGNAEWHQTTDTQFNTGTLTGTATSGSGSVMLSGSGTLAKVQTTKVEPTATGSSVPFVLSTQPSIGNLLVAFVGTSDYSEDRTPTAPDGTWTKFIDQANANVQLTVWWKVVQSGDGTSYTFPISGTVEWYSGVLYEIDGADTATPIDQSAVNTGSQTTPTVTPTVIGTLALSVLETDDGSTGGITLTGVSSGWTADQTARPSYHTTYAASRDALTTDTTTGIYNVFTLSGSPTTPVAATVLIKPAAASGSIMSPEINYSSFDGAASWNEFAWSETETTGSVSLQLYYTASTACDTIVPNTALSGNSTGFASGPVSLTGLNTSTYASLCLKATLTNSGGTPYLNDWTMSVSNTLVPSIDSALGKSTDSWNGAVPVYMTLTNLSNGDYPYARAQVTTAASQTFYASMSWSSGNNRFEGVIYPGSNLCAGCDDPTYGTFSVTVQLDNNAGFPSVDYSDSAGSFTTVRTFRRSSMDNATNTNYADFNPVWNTDHWDVSIDDFGFAMQAGSGSNIAVAIPIYPSSAAITNIAVAFNGSGVSAGSAQTSGSNAWWWESATHTLYVQFATLTTTLVDVDIDFSSDTDLHATRFNWVYTADMGSRDFANGIIVFNQYLTAPIYGVPQADCSGHECENGGMQAETRAHDPGGPDESTDCMERVAVHVDDTPRNDGSGSYGYDIKWKTSDWANWITQQDNDAITIVIYSDDTASTGWAQQLNNGIAAKRTQTFYAGKRYIYNFYEFTNNGGSTRKYPLVWEREQWHGTDRQTNDHGRFYGDASDVVMEQRVSMAGYAKPWMSAYDSGTFVNMGLIYNQNNLPDYGIFAVEAFLSSNAPEWPISITASHATQTTDQTGFEKSWATVAPAQTVGLSFWHVHNTASSWSEIAAAMDADSDELNPTAVISVTVEDGVVSYGTIPTNTSKSTCSSELNDAQIVTNNGNVAEDFLIKGADSDNWTLGSSVGANQYVHQFRSGSCSSFSAGTALTTSDQAFSSNVAVSGTVTLNLQLTTPNSTSSYSQQTTSVTVTATQH